MMKSVRLIQAWLPAVAFMAFIFYLSSRQSVQVSGTFIVNFFFFKALHIIEYAVLYLLIFRAVFLSFRIKVSRKIYIIAAVLTLLYAISDEVHQTYIPSRTGRPRDLLFDAAGMFLMYSYIRMHLSKLKKLLV